MLRPSIAAVLFLLLAFLPASTASTAGAPAVLPEQSVMVGLELVVSSLGGDYPVSITHAGDGSGRLFLVLQSGQIRIYDGIQVLPTPFLDLTSRVFYFGEQGLLGLAFPPDYGPSGHFYVYYTNSNSDNVVARYYVTPDPNVADFYSEEIVLTLAHPGHYNHNGGQLAFGPDGYLYAGPGDGGGNGDPEDNGQDPASLLGKLLRLDVETGSPLTYTIPSTNPFVGLSGYREEIWALGMRNPWRFSFDRLTGGLFVGDVGQDTWEEVDLQPASSPGGENYGWKRMEGTHCYDPPADCDDGTLSYPVLEYDHSLDDCAVIGGVRYRGSRIPELYGSYLYGDYCSGRIWAAEPDGSGAWAASELLDTPYSIISFGEEQSGEIYVGDQSAGGQVFRLVGLGPHYDLLLPLVHKSP